MTSWTIIQKLFWDSLINRLWLVNNEESQQDSEQRIASLHASMEWVAEFVLADLDNRQPILRVVEDSALHILRYIGDESAETERAARIFITKILEPFLSHGLLKEFDPIFRSLIGYVIGSELKITEILRITEATGESFDIILTQEEIEHQACEVLKLVVAGQQPEQLRYLLPFHLGILLEHSLDGSIGESSAEQPLRLSIPEEVPLLLLPLAADPSLRKQLFDHFLSLFEIAEPPLAKILRALHPGLIAKAPTISQKNLCAFYRAYLLSTHFQFARDPIQGFDYLANLDLEKLDALCGEMPPWLQGASFQEVLEALLNMTKDTQEGSLPSPKPSTWFPLLRSSRLAFSGARSSESILNKYAEEQRSELLSHWVETTEADFDVFHSLIAGLELLLHASYCFPNLKVFVGETERPLREWLTEHLLKVLRYKPEDSVHKKTRSDQESQLIEASQLKSVGKSTGLDSEFLRRSIHAKLLRCAFRAVSNHMKALSARKTQAQEHDLIGELLIRSTILSYRLLPILLHHTRMSLEQIDQCLAEVVASKGIPWSHLYLQDQFNPELYGPEVGQYDHLLAGTLAVFREVGINRSTVESTTRVSSSLPFWLTRPVKRALMAVANRPENEAERRIREARERGVPNRLQTYLDRTPQEYAAELLRFASPGLTKDEDLLLKGRAKLLELFRQTSDDVNVDIKSPSQEMDSPDMIARLKVGEKEKNVLIAVRTSAEPRYLRQAIGQLQSYVKRFSAPYGLIVAPSISERGGKLCEEHGIGYLDMQGNASIKFDGIFIKTVAARKGKRQRGRTKTLFAPVSTRLVRAFLAAPERQWKLQELAAATQMSLGQAYKVKQALLNQEFIDTDPKRRLFLQDPTGLLNTWRETYRYEKNKALSLFSLDKIPAIEEKVKQYCDARKIRYALTLFSGAEKLAPFVRYSLAAFYVMGDPEELVQALQLKPVASGANVLLFSPYDAGVFYGLQESQGFKIVSTIQLYLDLYSYGSRGREQAEFLREKLLGF